MYATCTFCYAGLGTNDVLESFPVSRRVAFDPNKACLWAVCPHSARWNLAPIEERWETVEDGERRFRATPLRYTSGNIAEPETERPGGDIVGVEADEIATIADALFDEERRP